MQAYISYKGVMGPSVTDCTCRCTAPMTSFVTRCICVALVMPRCICRPITGRRGGIAEHLYKMGVHRPQSGKVDFIKDGLKKGLKYAVGGAVFYFAVSLALGGRDRVRHDLEVLKVSCAGSLLALGGWGSNAGWGLSCWEGQGSNSRDRAEMAVLQHAHEACHKDQMSRMCEIAIVNAYGLFPE